jgi:hypothetical protein
MNLSIRAMTAPMEPSMSSAGLGHAGLRRMRHAAAGLGEGHGQLAGSRPPLGLTRAEQHLGADLAAERIRHRHGHDIQLTYAPSAVPGVTGPATSYPAAYAGLSGGATTAPCTSSCAAPQVVSAPAGGGVSFTVDAAQDGYYDLGLRAAGSFRLTVDGTSLGSGPASSPVYLHAGINPVEYVAQTGATIGSLSVTPDAAAGASDAATYGAAAAQNVLAGTAVAQANQYAYDGADVGYIGDGSGNTLTFTGVQAAAAGTYRVTVSYADDDRQGTANYNTNLIDRAFTVTTPAGTNETVYARNTYSWDQFDTVMVTVQLTAGGNTITFGNASYKLTVAPAVLR